MKTNNIYFYNLTVRLSDKELLDLLEDFILPAIFSEKVKRNRSSQLRFMNCFVYTGKREDGPDNFIAGRFVKQMQLSREQIVDGEVLRNDFATLESAPSLFFLLNIETHVISVLPETSGAPSVREFCSLLKHNMLQVAGLDSQLRAKNFVVKAVPFHDTDGFRQHIIALKAVKRFEIRSTLQNSQHHLQDLLNGQLNGINFTGSTDAKTQFRAGENTEPEKVADYIATDDLKSGGATAKVVGTNVYGADDVVESEKYLHAMPLNDPPSSLNERAMAVEQRFQTAVDDGTVRPISKEVKDRVMSEGRASLEKFRSK